MPSEPLSCVRYMRAMRESVRWGPEGHLIRFHLAKLMADKGLRDRRWLELGDVSLGELAEYVPDDPAPANIPAAPRKPASKAAPRKTSRRAAAQ